jgi:hypothetical protein
VFCLDLASETPSEVVRLEYLEDQELGRGHVKRSPEWLEIRGRCDPLRPVPDFDLNLIVRSDSVGVDSDWNVTLLDLEIRLSVGGHVGRVHTLGTCQPRVGLRALYEIPGRPELMALVSYVGRPYGCEEIEKAVLLQEGATD